MRNFIFFSFFILFIIILWNYSDENKHLIKIRGITMGNISYNIKYLNKEKINYKSAIDSILVDFNNSLSTYISDSELSKFNNSDTLFNISNELYTILKVSDKIHRSTKGAFDPTIGKLVNLWGFGPTKILETPDSLKVRETLKNVGFNQIYFDNKIAVRNNLNIYLDFSAIAKGYAVDIIAEFLNNKNIKNFMVEIGGEVRCSGFNENKNWIIGINDPLEKNLNLPFASVSLVDRSLATSGNYRNFYKKNNVIISHTIDPRTGFSSNSNILSASVFYKSCTEADAYATAFMVLGKNKSIQIVEKNEDLDVFLVFLDKNGNTKNYVSKGIEKHINLLKEN